MGVTFIAKEGTYTAPAKLTTKSITENGTYSAVDDSANGYSSVTVNVPLPTGKITITENGTNIDVAQYAKADVNVAGGSSDFSTATMTIVNNSQNAVSVKAPIVYDDAIEIGASIGRGISSAKTVVLYKNSGRALILDSDTSEPVNMSVSGNATIEDDVFVIYTGDCTVTIS